MSTQQSPVWFITGCSSGFGHELAKKVIARGWRLVATARDKSKLAELVKGNEANVLTLDLDVTKHDQVEAAAKTAEKYFGRVDVLVNNAGYGYMSSVEEGEEKEIRAQFDANVFGLFAITRAILPLMRKHRKGHVINITSIGGLTAFAGSSYYAATKHAVEGWSSSLAIEGKPLGIQVTCVEPGPFRTDWAGRSMRQTPSTIPDYAETVGARLKMTKANSGKQPGSPAKAADAIIEIAGTDNPPRYFLLGAFALDEAAKKIKAMQSDMDRWREAGLATDDAA